MLKSASICPDSERYEDLDDKRGPTEQQYETVSGRLFKCYSFRTRKHFKCCTSLFHTRFNRQVNFVLTPVIFKIPMFRCFQTLFWNHTNQLCTYLQFIYIYKMKFSKKSATLDLITELKKHTRINPNWLIDLLIEDIFNDSELFFLNTNVCFKLPFQPIRG